MRNYLPKKRRTGCFRPSSIKIRDHSVKLSLWKTEVDLTIGKQGCARFTEFLIFFN